MHFVEGHPGVFSSILLAQFVQYIPMIKNAREPFSKSKNCELYFTHNISSNMPNTWFTGK